MIKNQNFAHFLYRVHTEYSFPIHLRLCTAQKKNDNEKSNKHLSLKEWFLETGWPLNLNLSCQRKSWDFRPQKPIFNLTFVLHIIFQGEKKDMLKKHDIYWGLTLIVAVHAAFFYELAIQDSCCLHNYFYNHISVCHSIHIYKKGVNRNVFLM